MNEYENNEHVNPTVVTDFQCAFVLNKEEIIIVLSCSLSLLYHYMHILKIEVFTTHSSSQHSHDNLSKMSDFRYHKPVLQFTQSRAVLV